jgi:putative transposase
MSAMAEAEDSKRMERARAIGLFRYQLIREAADPAYSTKARGVLVRQIAAAEHMGPFGRPVRISRQTLDRWIRDWRRGGFDALVPSPRQPNSRTPGEVLDLAVALKRENSVRTPVGIARILRAQLGWSPDETTLRRHFRRLGLGSASAPPAGTAVFGRFEAARPNELWTGDAMHGPVIAGRKTYLFAFIDDHSRLLAGYRFGYAEDTVRLAAALRPALASRGVPESIYVDNGSAFVDSWLLRACAKLGIKLTHSTPGRPQGRGKVERLFRTVQDQFLVEVTGDPAVHAGHPGRTLVDELLTLNRLFAAWTETVYHRQVHSETGQAPLHRWQDGWSDQRPMRLPTPAQLAEAFLWAAYRTVTKTALVSLHANTYQVDPVLAGRRVELVFDPFDLTTIEVRLDGTPLGLAIPHRIGRHTHPKARPETPTPPPAPTGINYLRLVDQAHQQQLGDRINYTALIDTTAGDTADSDEPADSR